MSNMFSGIRNGKKLIKRYFLVDYENVQSYGLVGLSKLTDTDAVTVYFSDHANTLTFDLHMALNACKAKTDFQKVTTGAKNALDFQLSSQLGYIINQNIVAGNKDVKYYIVSMDNGFSVLCDFWGQFDANVMTVKSISAVVDPEKEKKQNNPVLEGLMLSEKEEQYVEECIKNSSNNLELHNALQKRFKDSQRAGEIYAVLKKKNPAPKR